MRALQTKEALFAKPSNAWHVVLQGLTKLVKHVLLATSMRMSECRVSSSPRRLTLRSQSNTQSVDTVTSSFPDFLSDMCLTGLQDMQGTDTQKTTKSSSCWIFTNSR